MNRKPHTTLNATIIDVAVAEESIDKMKTSADDMPVVLVGGGNVLFSDHVEGASEVYKPENGGVANAIGSAISQISGKSRKCIRVHNPL